MPEAERHTKVLTNVWANQVFKCLAYVDATWHAEKVIKSKIVYQVIHFWGKTQLPESNKVIPFWKGNTQYNKKAWVFTQLTWKLICFNEYII